MMTLILILLVALLVIYVQWLHRRVKRLEVAEGFEIAPFPIHEQRVRQLIADAFRERENP